MKRRTYLTLSGGALAALAGCSSNAENAETPSVSKEKLKTLKYDTKVYQALRVGESIGMRNYDEMWKVTIQEKYENGNIDILIEKMVLDEEGSNQESVDTKFSYNRKQVEPNDVERLESDFKVWYATDTGDESTIALSENLSPKSVSSYNGTREVTN